MTVERLIAQLSEFDGYLEVQLLLDSDRYTIEDVKRSQDASEHFVLLEG